MKILVIGTTENEAECKHKFGPTHLYRVSEVLTASHLQWADVVFDFLPNRETFDVDLYTIGFCGLPTFLNREMLEVCIANTKDVTVLDETCKQLNTTFGIVADQVGFITPRIICMIINEAYYTVEEGTASREDIDLAMKLGTNYPYGPFEWANRIGKSNVVALLNAVQKSTANMRYTVCKLLQHEIFQ
jgi:3-hydroxybutyryl-CoA dehydrogenase